MIRIDLTSIDEQWRQIALWLLARGCRGDVALQNGGSVGQQRLCHPIGGRASGTGVSAKVAPAVAVRSIGVGPFSAGFARPSIQRRGVLRRHRELLGHGAGAR